ncbi:MAG: glycosyltransferase family 4 protein [Solirubrobacteraceae bacterium]
MKVLAVSSYGVLAGSELSLAEFLAHRPAGIEASALLVEDGPLRARLEELGVPAQGVEGLDGRPGPAALAKFSRRLHHVLRTERPDVVWATGLKAAAMSVPACRLSGTPLVWHKVDFSLDDKIARPLGIAVNGVIGVSRAVTEALGPARKKVLGTVGPPVRLPDDARVEPATDPPAIGTLGRLIPIKGHEHIIRAGARLGVRVILAGDASPDYPEWPAHLRELAQAEGADVEFAGFTTDVLGTLARMTVFVTATYRDEHGFGWEGLSGAMLEASWVGLPLVAARGGGTAEGVVDGVTGTLVERADGDLIAAAAEPYLRDAELARRTGEAGAAYAREHFAPERASAKLFGLLERAVR